MIKFLLVGIWGMAVALGAAWGTSYWQAHRTAGAAHAKGHGGLETVKPKSMTVPVIVDGAITGYVVVQLVFTVEKEAVKTISGGVESFLVDEAFRAIYSAELFDPRRARKADLVTMAGQLREAVNKRFGSHLVQDVLIQEMSYVAKDDVRGQAGQRPVSGGTTNDPAAMLSAGNKSKGH